MYQECLVSGSHSALDALSSAISSAAFSRPSVYTQQPTTQTLTDRQSADPADLSIDEPIS